MALTGSNLDISVSQVNTQIGALMRRDLGLGLLFVTGQVTQVTSSTHGDGQRVTGFTLHDGECELRADLAPSLRHPPRINVGQTVRVTALVGFFYPESRFRLIVRDIELLETSPTPAPGSIASAATLPSALTMPAAAATPAPVAAPAPPTTAPASRTAPPPPVAPAPPPAPAPTPAPTPVVAAGPEPAGADDGLAPAVLPPWLEEIRRRQFGASGTPPPPATNEPVTTLAGLAPLEAESESVATTSAAATDADLQDWLAKLFDASESEDIELTRNESEIVAVRAPDVPEPEPDLSPSAPSRQERFQALGASVLAKLETVQPPAGATTGAPTVHLPPPPPAARELLKPAAAPATARPSNGATTRGLNAPAPTRTTAMGRTASMLQARASEPEVVGKEQRPAIWLISLAVIGVLALISLLSWAAYSVFFPGG